MATLNVNDILTALDVASLTDGDSIDIDGITVTYREEPDAMTSVDDDYDCYGRFAYVDRWHERDPRPDGFDGRARKLRTYHGDTYWWQPYDDAPVEHDERNARYALELLEYGFICIGIEVHGLGPDRRGMNRTAWLAGIESFADEDYRRDIIRDLLADILG